MVLPTKYGAKDAFGCTRKMDGREVPKGQLLELMGHVANVKTK